MTATDLVPAAEARGRRPSGSSDEGAADGWPWWKVAGPGLAVGATSALVGLDRRALWLDEAYSLGAIHQMRRTLPETSGTMGLYYVLLRAWTTVSESVWWMRSLSVLCALAAIVVLSRVATRLVGPRWAAVASVLVALAPLWLAYAKEARSYALVLLIVTGTWLALDHGIADAAADRRRRWWWLHTTLAALVPLAHGLTVLQLLPQLVVVAVAGRGWPTVARCARGILAAGVVTVGLLSLGAESVGDWVEPLGLAQLDVLVERFAGPAPWSYATVAVVVGGAVVSVVAAARAGDPIGRARALVPLAWGLAPIVLLAAVSVARPSFIARWAVGSVPGLVLLAIVAARAAIGGADRPAHRWRQAAGALVVLVVVAASLSDRIEVARESEDGWRMAARVVAEGVEPGDTVLLARETTTRPAFEAAWRDVSPAAPLGVVAGDRPLGEVRRFEPDDPTGDERWAAGRDGAGRLWVVGDERRLELDRLPWLVDGWAGRPPTHREVARWEDVDDGEVGVVVVLLEPEP